MIKIENAYKVYQNGDQKTYALNGLNAEIKAGEITVILGSSGSGKSTFLNMVGGMDRLSDGIIEINGEDITQFSDKKLTQFRRDNIGFVFQFYNLIPTLTVRENVAISAKLTNNLNKVDEALKNVGLEHQANHFPNQLSGGQMQRVSIARALAKQPNVLLADEPTGALDSKTGQQVIETFVDISKNNPDRAVVIVTHNAAIAKIAHQVLHLNDGHITEKIQQDPQNSQEVVY